MKTRLLRTVVGLSALLVTLSLVPTAAGQCLGPDNLDSGTCCQQVNATLPTFPQISMQGLGVCWNNCAPQAQNPLSVAWTAPTSTVCAEYFSTLTVVPGGGPALTGTMKLDYTRTWYEPGTAGTPVQVWRFAAKADLAVPPGSTSVVCPIPGCLPPAGNQPTAFFYGYVDYAQDCGTLTFQNSLVLYHACDFFIHTAGFSSRPGSYHPTSTYGIIAPHTSAQPFVPANLPHPSGPLTGEALRTTGTALGIASCINQDQLAGGALTFLAQGCVCPFGPAPAQYTINLPAGNGTCVNSAGLSSAFSATLFNWPVIPWPYMVSASIGSWSNPAVWPGTEDVWVNEGLFRYYDSCTQLDYFEVFYGASTDNGWPTFPVTPGSLVTQKFVDLAGNWRKTLPGPNNLPLMGNSRPTNHLIYVNLP